MMKTYVTFFSFFTEGMKDRKDKSYKYTYVSEVKEHTNSIYLIRRSSDV